MAIKPVNAARPPPSTGDPLPPPSTWLLLATLAALGTAPSGRVRRVPADYRTIQLAIDSARPGDTVLVAPGRYVENIRFGGKGIMVASEYLLTHDPAIIARTIIDGSRPRHPDSASVVLMIDQEDTSAVLSGFTLTGGTGTVWTDARQKARYREGGGILCELGSPVIEHNIIEGNQATRLGPGILSAGGGGIRCGYAEPIIRNNVIRGNRGEYGAGIVLYHSAASVRNNLWRPGGGGVVAVRPAGAVFTDGPVHQELSRTTHHRGPAMLLLRHLPAVAFGTLASILGPPATRVAPPTIVEYVIPRPGNFPHDPAVGADGSVWYTDQHNSYIGRFDPGTGKIVDYPTPTPGSGPHGITVAPDGQVWYTGQAAGVLGRVDPGSGRITEFPLPRATPNPHTPVYHRGRVWYTDANNNAYGSLDPATRKTTVYTAPTSNSVPYGIVPAGDGALWIAMLGTNKLGRVDPSTGTMREFVLPAPGARPRRLQVAGDGTVWYTDFARGYLGALDPVTGKVREWRSPSDNAGPYGIAIGTDGRIWYCESRAGNMVAFDPKTEKMDIVPIPTSGAIVRHMETDSTRGRIWLALSGTGRLGKIELGGR